MRPEDYTPICKRVMDCVPAKLVEYAAKRPIAIFIARIASLLLLFMFVDYFMRRAGFLDASGYEKPYLVFEILRRLGFWAVAAMIALTIVLMRYGTLMSRWSALDAGRQMRWFIVFLAALMAWPFSTYEYNFYFDQGHYMDRIAIAVLVLLVYYRPVFIYPFLLLAFAIMWQFGEPPLGFGAIFPHKLQVLHVLNLFAAVFLVHALTGSRRIDDFLLFTCCLVAAAYWVPSISKWELDWLTHGHLYHMPLAAYAHGWLAYLEPATIVTFANKVSRFDWPMMLSVLLFETGCIVFLWRRSVSVTLLATTIVFHIAVFILYGYLFWTWISLNAALLVLLVRDRKTRKVDIYQPRHFVASVILIGFASYWCNPSGLAWLDTRLSYTYRFEAIGESGKRYTLTPEFFGPYAAVMTMGNFPYLVPDLGLLVGPYGVSRVRARADEIMPLKTADEIFALESAVGQNKYDPEHAAQFYEFIVRYVRNRTANPERAAVFRAIGPAPQFWSFDRGNAYHGEEPIREIIIKSITTLFDDERLVVIREFDLKRLTINAE